MLTSNKECDICKLPIKKTYYIWTINGKKQKLCPKCNNRLEHKVGKERFNGKFG
jgi:hypothetical protein